MSTTTTERRLVAILASDIVGYSRLIEQDEAATLASIRTFRREVTDPLIAEHRGRIIKLMGDGAIVEFASVVDAVQAAIAIQKAAAEHGKPARPTRRIVLRIGINLGDVVVDGDDLYGDGVNVAARLEQLCAPGGVMISGTAYDHMQGKLGLPLDFAGNQHVKNISRAIPSYQVRLDGVKRVRPPMGRRLRASMVPIAVAVAGILLAGAGAWWWLRPGEAGGRPSIAVLPFDAVGPDETTGRLADGVTEDIITDLARYREFDVIARNSTKTYKGKAIDVRQVGRDLNVGYALEGSIQRQAEQVRVTVQLVRTTDGSHVWSERWDRPVADVFAVQTEVAERVANQLGGYNVMYSESKTAVKRKRPGDLKAYDLYVLGSEAADSRTEEAEARATAYLDQAIERDPQLARAYVRKGWILNRQTAIRKNLHETFLEMERLGKTAVGIDPNDAMAHMLLGTAFGWEGRNQESLEETQRALALNPSSANVLVRAADQFAFYGKQKEGAALCDRAFRLDPGAPAFYYGYCVSSYFMAQRFEDVVGAIKHYRTNTPKLNAFVLGELAMAQIYLGHSEEAAASIKEFNARYPKYSVEYMINNGWLYDRPEDEQYLLASWRKTGLRICAKDEELKDGPVLKRLPECTATAK